MTRWSAGSATIEQMIKSHDLERVSGEAADGAADLLSAETALNSASSLVNSDPRTAYIAAYDAARMALVALLLQQGLRPTTSGGHICIGEATRAQFGAAFRDFDALRRRRNDLEYPLTPGDRICATAEAQDAVARGREILSGAQALIGELGFFT